MLFLCEELDHDMLLNLYKQIDDLIVCGNAVSVERRVGPLTADAPKSGAPSSVRLHAAVHDRESWESTSPATQILLEMSAESIGGDQAISPTFRGLNSVDLEMKFARDLQYLQDIFRSQTAPFWTWSEHEHPVKIWSSQPAQERREEQKLLRHAAALITGWVWIMHDRKLHRLSGWSLAQLLRLASDVNRADTIESAAQLLPTA